MSAVKWRAFVSDNNDPTQRHRIRVKIPDAFQDPLTGKMDQTDWCLPAHGGVEYVPTVGSTVWVEFEKGPGVDHRGIWSGAYPSIPDGTSETINVARAALGGNFAYGRGIYEVATADFSVFFAEDTRPPASQTIVEPESFQATEYPKCAVIKSPEKKAFTEYDDTGSGRIHHHVGDYYHEVTGDGTLATRSCNKTEFVMESENRVIEGPQTEHVAGTVVKNYEEDAATYVAGRQFFKAGSAVLQVGPLKIDVGALAPGMELFCGSDMDVSVMSRLSFLVTELLAVALNEVKMTAPDITLQATTGTADMRSNLFKIAATQTKVVATDVLGALPTKAVACASTEQLTALHTWISSVTAAFTSIGITVAPPATGTVLTKSTVLEAGVAV